MSVFAEYLSSISNPQPQCDPEDYVFEESRAKLVEKDLIDEIPENDSNIQQTSQLRKHVLQSEDISFPGKVVSRKEAAENFNSSSDEDDAFDMLDAIEMDEEEEESISVEDNFEPIISQEQEVLNSNEDAAPDIFSAQKAVSRNLQSLATVNQINLWELVLEMRIKMQTLTAVSSRLPKFCVYSKFTDHGGESLISSVKETALSVDALGTALTDLQYALLKQTPVEKESELKAVNNAPLKTDTWTKRAQKMSCRLRIERNHILKYWYNKIKLSSKPNKSFSNFEHSTDAQIEHALADLSHHIQRTKLCRLNCRVLGCTGSADEDKNDPDFHLKQTDEENFNDDDFYQQLLRQLIEWKMAPDVADAAMNSIQMTRNWLKMQSRKKVKKNVDTKASKGRNIRYHVHSKLLNFTAPVNKKKWSDESCNQLLKSVFGKLGES
ncbi:unnamed protein product [Clavelina lepadiformis]|uniref:Protein AATF n=1 Tax=Clavelina lepadiformis TaxID=159417 RepID=A0ABP0EV00_CLALP